MLLLRPSGGWRSPTHPFVRGPGQGTTDPSGPRGPRPTLDLGTSWVTNTHLLTACPAGTLDALGHRPSSGKYKGLIQDRPSMPKRSHLSHLRCFP